ncbi:lipoprotein [Paracoccaceae bacterium GXU_MW_L88]
MTLRLILLAALLAGCGYKTEPDLPPDGLERPQQIRDMSGMDDEDFS